MAVMDYGRPARVDGCNNIGPLRADPIRAAPRRRAGLNGSELEIDEWLQVGGDELIDDKHGAHRD